MQPAFRQFSLLGSGRLARHLQHYLKLLGLPFVTWSRIEDPDWSDLHGAVENSSHVLLAVSDSAIADVAGPLRGSHRRLVHFSGAMTVPGVAAAHPLMTFGEGLQDLEWYRAIPFVVDAGTAFGDLLPGLPNPSVTLSADQKTLYHALCALAGNSTYLLWRKIGSEFETLGLPREMLKPYLHQVVENSLSEQALDQPEVPSPRDPNFTGPVAREDWQVVRGHIRALARSSDLRQAYESFLRLARSTGIELPKDLQ